MKLVFSPVALEDLQRLYAFIADKNPAALKKAAERLIRSFQLLTEHPIAGYALEHLPGIREFLVPFGKGNYIIRYRIYKEQISIAHLWHSREDRSGG